MSSTSGVITPDKPRPKVKANPAPPAPASRVMTLPPESVFERVSALATIEDDEKFFAEAVSFVVMLTGARAGILFGRDKKGGSEPKLVVNATEMELKLDLVEEVNAAATISLNAMQAHRQTVKTDIGKLALLCSPFRQGAGDDGASIESLALVLMLGPERAPYLEPIFSLLQLTVANLMQRSQRVEMENIKRGFLQATLLIDLFTKASSVGDYKQACAIVVSELQDWIGCDRTAIASGKGNRLNLDAVSGLTEVQKRTQGSTHLLSLLQEATVIEAPLAWPPTGEKVDGKIMAASDQGELLNLFSAEQTLAIPLTPTDEDNPSKAAMAFFWQDKKELDSARYQLIDAATPHISALFALLKKALPSGIFGKVRRFRQTASRWKKVAVFAVPIILLLAMLIPVPHRVSASARITPAVARQVAAPISGILEETFVKPGETVAEDTLLAKLDGKEIGWQLAEAIANREVARRRRDQARAKKDVPATQLAQHEYDALTIEANLLRYKQNNLEIRAPIAGLILSGDLKRSRGVPVETGQKLFDIASLDKLKIDLAVPDEDIHYIKPGMIVKVRLESRASRVVDAKVEEIYPVSEVKDGENVFVCLATIENTEGALRPGMRGRARISSEWKSLGWVLFHKPWEWLRLKVM